MTISTETSSAGPYYGNDVTTVFPYGFKIVDEKHLRVVFIDATGNVSDLSLDDGDYSVTGVGSEDGGTVVKASPLLTGQTLTIVRDPPLTQETALENQGPYNASVVENRLDLMVMQIQSVKEATDRSFKVEPGQPAPSLQLIAAAEGFASAAQQSAQDAAASASAAAGLEITYQEYVVAASQWSAKAQDWAVKMDGLVDGTDYSAKYWANQAYLAGGVPVGTIIDIYGNGTTVPPGYLRVIPGLEVTGAYPQLRAFGLANGWVVNGSGNPVMPNVDAFFKRGWASGQANDAGRAFGSVQLDALQNITGSFSVRRRTGPGNTVAEQVGAFAPNGDGVTLASLDAGPDTLPTVSTKFDASLVARTATETRPINITVTYWIKAYDAPVDAALLDLAQLTNDLADARAKVGGGALGVNQTYQNVSASRAASTAYQNTTGRTIAWALRVISPTARAVEMSPDGVSWSTYAVTSTVDNNSISLIVPAGWYYRINGSVASISVWMELR